MAIPNSFISANDLRSLAAAAPIAWAAGNAFQNLTKRNPRWFIASIALAIAIFNSLPLQQPVDYLVMVLNGCLIFVTASGIALYANQRPPELQQGPPRSGFAPDERAAVVSRSFLTSWLH